MVIHQINILLAGVAGFTLILAAYIAYKQKEKRRKILDEQKRKVECYRTH